MGNTQHNYTTLRSTFNFSLFNFFFFSIICIFFFSFRPRSAKWNFFGALQLHVFCFSGKAAKLTVDSFSLSLDGALCGKWWWWWYLKQKVCIHWIYMATSYSQKACYSGIHFGDYPRWPPYPTIFWFLADFLLCLRAHSAHRCWRLIHWCSYHAAFFTRKPSVSLRFIRIKKAKMNCF